MIAGGDNKLPFGTNPRLILALGLYRSSTHPKPCIGPGEVAVRLHAAPGGLQQQRGKAHTPGEALEERTRERVRVTPSQATTEVFRNE